MGGLPKVLPGKERVARGEPGRGKEKKPLPDNAIKMAPKCRGVVMKGVERSGNEMHDSVIHARRILCDFRKEGHSPVDQQFRCVLSR